MVDPALGVLYKAMKISEKGGKPVPLAVLAARDVLDRAGYKATDKLQLSGTGPAGELVHTTAADLLRAEFEALSERIVATNRSTNPCSSDESVPSGKPLSTTRQ